MLKSDFHIHTSFDRKDGKYIKYSPKDIIRIAGKKNFEVLSFAHHNQIFYNKDIVSFAKKHNILLVPAVEADIEGRHVLLLNYKDKKPVDTFDKLENIRDENVVVIAPHPFFPRANCLRNLLIKHIDLFDAIEYSHFYVPFLNFNNKAVLASRAFGLPLVGNSDAHMLCQFNKTFSFIDSDKKIDSVLEAIRKGNVKLRTKPLDLITFSRITLSTIF